MVDIDQNSIDANKAAELRKQVCPELSVVNGKKNISEDGKTQETPSEDAVVGGHKEPWP